jgi:hypothetical protein
MKKENSMTYVPRALLLLPARRISMGSSEQDIYGMIDFDKNMHGGFFDRLRSLMKISTSVVKALGEKEDPFDMPADRGTWVLPGAHSLSVASGYCDYILSEEPLRKDKLLPNQESLNDLFDGTVNQLTGKTNIEEALQEEDPVVIDFSRWHQELVDESVFHGSAEELWKLLEGNTLRSEVDRITVAMGGPFEVKRGVPLTWIRPEEKFSFYFEAFAKHHDGEWYETVEQSMQALLGAVEDTIASLNR